MRDRIKEILEEFLDSYDYCAIEGSSYDFDTTIDKLYKLIRGV